MADSQHRQDPYPSMHLFTKYQALCNKQGLCRRFVELELSRRFYNHTAVALHDWHTYSQLALLARSSLGLQVAVPQLPGTVLDPGGLQPGSKKYSCLEAKAKYHNSHPLLAIPSRLLG